MSALDNRIAAQYRKLAVMDYRIGRMMSQRVEMEKKLATMLDERNRRDGVHPPCPDCEEHPFG